MNNNDKIIVINEKLKFINEYIDILEKEISEGVDWSDRLEEYTIRKNVLEEILGSLD